jgi:pilus assembly protein CpaC
MIINGVIKRYPWFVLMIMTFSLLFGDRCWGEDTSHLSIGTSLPQKLTLTVGKSMIIESPRPIKRVTLPAPEIADAMILTPRQIYLTGKSPGITNLTLWEDNKVFAIFDLEVSPDISRLKERLYEVFPQEGDIRVSSTHDNITLSGTVSSTANLTQVLALAEPYAPQKVMNLLEVGGVHQVMLEVRVAEMSRSLTKRLGFNFNYISSSSLGLSMLNNLTQLPEEGKEAMLVSDPVNLIFSFFGADMSWTTFIDALKENGLVKILAEPTLITISGQTANFLAGGEFPIPVAQEFGRTTIIFKEFGVGLNFTPTVLSSEKISMKVAPEVSELDFSNSIALSGFVVPAITTRRVSTVIELADGQSFAIAGLLQDNVREVVSKFPVLGDIPIMGALFRSSLFQKNESELIIIVTPHLVKPLDMAKQTLPTDQYIEPSDWEFYLLGSMEGEGKGRPTTPPGSPSSYMGKEGGLEGDFGHIIPQ